MIAAYQRISRADGDLGKDGKDKSNSIENQKELIQRYISCKESLQNVPVMDFVDDGYTGSNFDRPGFQQMMDGVRNGKIDTIIVKDLSRFGRDYIGVGEYMEQKKVKRSATTFARQGRPTISASATRFQKNC